MKFHKKISLIYDYNQRSNHSYTLLRGQKHKLKCLLKNSFRHSFISLIHNTWPITIIRDILPIFKWLEFLFLLWQRWMVWPDNVSWMTILPFSILVCSSHVDEEDLQHVNRILYSLNCGWNMELLIKDDYMAAHCAKKYKNSEITKYQTHIIGSTSWPKKKNFQYHLSGVVVDLLEVQFLPLVKKTIQPFQR